MAQVVPSGRIGSGGADSRRDDAGFQASPALRPAPPSPLNKARLVRIGFGKPLDHGQGRGQADEPQRQTILNQDIARTIHDRGRRCDDRGNHDKDEACIQQVIRNPASPQRPDAACDVQNKNNRGGEIDRTEKRRETEQALRLDIGESADPVNQMREGWPAQTENRRGENRTASNPNTIAKSAAMTAINIGMALGQPPHPHLPAPSDRGALA